jgi:demethylmenaquinone methyltransferase / 2-methoxy-6-polyprenyl-1,4-benzoquinol methylase
VSSSPPSPLPEGADKQRMVRELFDRISGRYDLVNRVMTLGMDIGWRRRTAGELRLPAEARVIDLACGTGDLCRDLRRNGYRAVGVDFAHGMLERAGAETPLIEADVLHLPFADGIADGATCGFALRNVIDLDTLFRETARVVRFGGRVAFLETSRPERPLLRRGHAIYFERVVPLIGAALSDGEAYRYLPRSMAYLPDPGELLRRLREAGFPDAERFPLSGGIAQLLVGTRG